MNRHLVLPLLFSCKLQVDCTGLRDEGFSIGAVVDQIVFFVLESVLGIVGCLVGYLVFT